MSWGCNTVILLDLLMREITELSYIMPTKYYKEVHHHGMNVCIMSTSCRKFCQRNKIMEYLTAIFFSNAVLMKAWWLGRINGLEIPTHQKNNLKYLWFQIIQLSIILDLPIVSFFLIQNSYYSLLTNSCMWTLAI